LKDTEVEPVRLARYYAQKLQNCRATKLLMCRAVNARYWQKMKVATSCLVFNIS